MIPDFNIVSNLTTPCAHCGIPACGKEYYLWTKDETEKPLAIVFDGGLFDAIGEDYFNHHMNSVTYADLPGFMKEWNECRGWSDPEKEDSHRIPLNEFLSTLEILNRSTLTDWIMTEFRTYHRAFLNFIQDYDVDSKGLYILRT